MSFDSPESIDQKITQGSNNLGSHWRGVMEGRARTTMEGKAPAWKSRAGSVSQGNKLPFSFSYFSIESLLVLLCLTASLLILPVILPPLPPPPFMLLLLPIAILVVLFVLVFMPSDVRDIATSYV